MTTGGRRILVASPYVPAPVFGFGTRVFELVRQLSLGNEVTVICFAAASDASDLEVLRGLVRDVHTVERAEVPRQARRLDQLVSLLSATPFHVREHHRRAMQRAMTLVTGTRHFDVIQLEGSQLCSYKLPAEPALVLDEHNIEYEVLRRMSAGERTRLRRAFSAIEHQKFRRLERRWWRKAHGIAVTSDRELPVVRTHAPSTPVAVVPNAVDPGLFVPDAADPVPDSVLFMGTLKYRPNVDAVRFLIDAVMPEVRRRRPEAVLTIIGDAGADDARVFGGQGVMVTGKVRDVRPYLARAAVTVAPIRVGGGTRLKVLEALAMGKAVVSTSLGCEGLAVRSGEHVLVADQPEEFAAAIAGLLADPSAARRLGEAGRALVVTDYSWAGACQRLEDLYDETDRKRRTA